MSDLATRFLSNPILSPKDLKPSSPEFEITCLLNPGAFEFQNKTWLLVRVAERPTQKDGYMSFPILTAENTTKVMEIALDDPDLNAGDARVITYKGRDYLTTLSHLRLVCSDDGEKFYEPEGYCPLFGRGYLQAFGIEDCRVTFLEGLYYLTFTAVSENGVGVGMKTTSNWLDFTDHGMIIPPHNKDCALFNEKINGKYYALHRPSSVEIGGNFIWLAESPDGLYWGNHQCVMRTRSGHWDSKRIGAGAAPIKTTQGWLEIYHGATESNQYCLGAVLLDLNEPAKVLARSNKPIMLPQEQYELCGFFGNVIFTNGHILAKDNDTLTVYYGAADEFVCAAKMSVSGILKALADGE